MTAPSSIDIHFLHEHLASASPDLPRSVLTTFITLWCPAEADAVCDAGYGDERGAEEVTTSETVLALSA